MSKIKQSIESLLQKHRILLWYDAEEAFTEEYKALELSNAKKLTVNGNEWQTKVQVLHEEPSQKFLLYLPKEKPADEENWLLDIELAHHVYHTDQEALYLQEVGLGYHYKEWISGHIEFFKNKERVAAFKEIAQEEDGDRVLSLKLLQVVFKADMLSLDQFLRSFASSFMAGDEESVERELERFNLKEIFWQEVSRKFGYSHDKPTIYDFLLEAFQKNFTPLSNQAIVNRETGVMLSNWKDTLSFQEDFKAISQRIQSDLQIEELLNDVSIDEVLKDDLFELIDQRILSELIRGILDGSTDRKRIESVFKTRESQYWFDRYQNFYRALKVGFNLLETVQNTDSFEIESFEQGIEQYTKQWYQVDQYYRLFIEYYKATNQNNVLNPLYKAVNKAYSNNWLLKQGEAWQKVLDDKKEWKITHRSQTRFYNHQVKPFIDKNIRLFVIISDALRYECGEAFHRYMLKENRFESDLDYQIAPLPSYTQLGMAALLPNKKLSFGKGDEILADGKSTKGTPARANILADKVDGRATAVLAKDLMKLASKSEEARSLVTNHDLIYVYHNRIDNLGDDKSSE